jgi:hypothetical protein
MSPYSARMTHMDDLLIAMIIAGIGLSVAYLRAELVLHRRMTAAQGKREVLHIELHTKRVSLGRNDMSRQPRTYPSSIQANAFQVVRGLARALRISIQERNFHRF